MPFLFNPFTGTFDLTGSVSIGSFDNTSTAKGLDITGSTISLHAADGTNPGAVTTTSQTFAGSKTFSSLAYVNGGIDTSSPATLAIGTLNATTINIGNVGATVNILGTVITENTTTLNVTNPVFTVNSGGAAGSGSNSGMQINENSIITGYVETSADRNSWIAKAPNTAGIATITPGSAGITLAGNVSGTNTGDVTIGNIGFAPTAKGASISGQVITLQPADGTHPGVVSTSSQTFGGAKTFSSIITADITGQAGTVVTNANLSGPVTSVGNTTSVTQTGTGSTFVMDTSPTLVTPNLGTPSTLIGTNISGTGLNFSAGNGNFYLSSSTSVYDGTNSTLTFTGADNTVHGVSSGNALASGAENTLYGYKSGFLITGSNNTILGSKTLLTSAAASDVLAIGYLTDSTSALTTGSTFVAIGNSMTLANAAVTNNVMIGHSITNNSTSTNSVLIGCSVSDTSITGNNVVIGKGAATTKTGTTCLGQNAMTQGTQTVSIGASSAATGNFAIALGYNTLASGINSMSLGVSATTNKANNIVFGANLTASANASCFVMGTSTSGQLDPTTATNQWSVGTPDVPLSSLYLGRGAKGDGTATNISINPSPMVGSNLAGATNSINGGVSTGTGLGGSVLVKTSPAGSTGSAANALVTVASFDSTGAFNLNGSSSGVVSIKTQATAGTFNFNLPTTAGTAGQALTSQGGSSSAMTWTSLVASSAGDISETSFSAANNQGAAANVTGLAFANATVRSFDALVSVYINATSSLYEAFNLTGIQRGSDWMMSQTSVGDASGFTFTITTAGQVQYTSGNSSGFVATTVKYKAITTSV